MQKSRINNIFFLSSNDYLPFGDTLNSTGKSSHRDWNGYQYALCSPVKIYDRNGKWAVDSDLDLPGGFTYIEGKINTTYYNDFLVKAPATEVNLLMMKDYKIYSFKN
jgi:hypothetical protein